ncbi:ClcB-like voltage-gated chloride channel protein [Luteolibacter ambystomatis]|uniref:ClcB-like voltage-gated chloride channel protein n=1 Tax=Luteolibacter ambystomatis TaxID=2824561 RepID=A0A975IZX9_9BACT|nr:ClcB-like voltage-gated chloride channel protein [Luteolibacter ambystomatis]QUE50715.1 ClcB-like voltage-gated chloride channel protein [Luteolibacter ambystomatis]
MTEADGTAGMSKFIRRLVRVRIWLGERLRFNELQATLLWAAIIGFLGAWTSIAFKEATEWLHHLFTGFHQTEIASFKSMPTWRRLLIPTIGGLLAGLTLLFRTRFKAQANSTDYMEAVVVGDGNLSVRVSLVKSVSAWFSGASGASIGREGPLVQLSSLVASVLGRWLKFPLARKRQLVACGAAAGIASAYHAPIAGAFFVAEIVLGSVAMEAFGPLVISSVIATLTIRAHEGDAAILEGGEAFTLHSNAELLPYVGLGIACGLATPMFLSLMKGGERAFSLLKAPVWVKLALGGLIVGAITVFRPEVVGNGRELVIDVLTKPWAWQALAVVLICKLLATAATFGSGAVGGVFTPTLFAGAAFGYLFGIAMCSLFPAWGMEPGAFGLIGMGAFLAAATGAPVMAIIMIFELTLNYQILMPVMLASVVAYYICRSLKPETLYGEALKRKGAAAVAQHLATLKVGDLMTPDTGTLSPNATFGEVARAFLQSRHEFLHIVHDNRFLGVVSLHDIKPYLDQPELESLLIARDVMRDDFTRLQPDQTMNEALELFGQAEAERLPVTAITGELLGAVTKTDVLLFLAGKPKKQAVAA